MSQPFYCKISCSDVACSLKGQLESVALELTPALCPKHDRLFEETLRLIFGSQQ
jgi:hypothetical protein